LRLRDSAQTLRDLNGERMDHSPEPTRPESDAESDAWGGLARAKSAPVLQAALRRARADNAERSEAIGDLRDAEHARLDILRERLQPIFDEIPEDCDIFDLGLAPGARPRLFIDMIGFIELGRDGRSYRLLQDSRHGRLTLCETDSIDVIARAVADYIARRLVEREKALAADAQFGRAAAPTARERAYSPARPARFADTDAHDRVERASRSVGGQPHAAPLPRPTALRVFARMFVFLIEVVGSAALFGLLAAGVYWLWTQYVR
jgi:hypothetical protein